jgi:hypothetical protein
MSVVPEEIIKEKDEEIVALIKEIDSLVNELKSASEETKAEIINKITEREKDLRAIRQKKGQFKAVLPLTTKLW